MDFRTEASGFQYLKELITQRTTGARRTFRAIRGVGFKIDQARSQASWDRMGVGSRRSFAACSLASTPRVKVR